VRNSTIAFNKAQADNNGTGAGGGFSAAAGATGSVQLVSTIVANNTDPSATTKDLNNQSGTPFVASFSLIQTTPAAAAIANVSNTTQVGVDPLLQPLASNGGPTQTHALGIGSTAINRGFNPVGLATDQRGPGFPRVNGGTPDVGAFETPQPAPNPSQTFTVSSLAATGANTLNDAILMANNTPGTNQIVFTGAALSGTINLTAEIPIKNNLIILGPGSANLTVNGSNIARIFNIDDAAAGAINVSISGLTLTNANSGAANQGGAILDTNETVTLSDVTITNSTAGTKGGAIAVSGPGALTIQNSTISGNKTLTADGGGVYAATNATVLVQNSTVSGNLGGRNGGGVYLFNGGNLTVQDSTVSGNSSGNTTASNYGGGGLYFFGTGTLLVQRSTISGNSTKGATQNGGGVFLRNLSGSATFEDSTISGNTTNRFGGGIAFQSGTRCGNGAQQHDRLQQGPGGQQCTGAGGGFSAAAAATGTVQLVSTILANNTDPSATTKDLNNHRVRPSWRASA